MGEDRAPSFSRRFTGGPTDGGAIRLGHLLRLASVLGLIFAVFWGVHTAVLLQAAKRQWVEEANRRLRMMTQTVAEEIRTAHPKILAEPAILSVLARQYGAYRISLLDRDGRILADTSGREQTGQPDPLLGTTLSQMRGVWDGAQLMTAPYLDKSETQIRSYFMPVRGPDLKVLGVLRVDLDMPPIKMSGPAAVTGLLLKIVGAAAILVLVLYTLRVVIGRHRLAVEEKTGMGETAAVIDTFHGLVRQLKEKELELEHLKALAEERAADVESYNEDILQSVASGVITFNPRHVITTFNHAAERILGLPRSGAIGKTCEEVFGAQSSIVHLLDEALTRHRTITRQELDLTRPMSGGADPHRIRVGVSTSLLRDRQDQLIGTTFVFTDLTEIKSLQEQVELKRRLTVLGEMSAGIAHEFRNYMGSVMGFTKLLSKKLPSSDSGPDSGQAMVASIMRELTAMNHLIEQLLSFGRHADLDLQPVALEPMIRRLLDPLIAQAEGKKPRVEVSIPSDLPEIRMDEVLIRQAVGNLLQNALDAMPDGGQLQIHAAVLDHSLFRGPGDQDDRKELLLEIRDTGIGIPRDKLDKIFLPFFTTKEKGTGMGLALVHKIILSHGGRIEVDSREGRGTTFRILMPMTAGVWGH